MTALAKAAAVVNNTFAFSPERAPTTTNPQLSDSNKNLALSPKGQLDAKKN
jgi:hypothetical protein